MASSLTNSTTRLRESGSNCVLKLPFGEELFADTGGRTPQQGYSASDGVQQKFTGQQRDNETALDYFNARYYSSTQGRFTSADLVAGSPLNPQTFNLYSYVRNNPLRYIDPTGHIAQDPICDARCAEELRKKAEAEGIPTVQVTTNQPANQPVQEAPQRSVLDLPIFGGNRFCLAGLCNGTSIRQEAQSANTAVKRFFNNAEGFVRRRMPDGVTASGTFAYLFNVNVTLDIVDFDVFVGTDFGGLSEMTLDHLLKRPPDGIGGSLTATYIASSQTRGPDFAIRTGSAAQQARYNFFDGRSDGVLACARGLCGGAQHSKGVLGVTYGIGTGFSAGPSYSKHVLHIPVEKLPALRFLR